MEKNHLPLVCKVASPSANALIDVFECIGTSLNHADEPCLVIKSPGSPDSTAITMPLYLLGHGKQAPLCEFLTRKGFVDHLPHKIPKIVEFFLGVLAKFKHAPSPILDNEGFHEISIRDETYPCFVFAGESHLPNKLPGEAKVVLIGSAAKTIISAKNISDFNKEFSVILKDSPRLLISLLIALHSYLAKPFGVNPLSLALIGKTAIGKTIVQTFIGNVVKGNPEIMTANATVIGLHEYCAEQGGAPALIEDAHGKAAAAPILSLIMDAGNGAKRLRSNYTTSTVKASKPLKGNLIISAEYGLRATAQLGGVHLSEGVFSRLFEVHAGRFGMFDDLCGFSNSAELARYIEKQGQLFSGVVGKAVISHVSKNYSKCQKSFEIKIATLKQKIVRAAGIDEELDNQSHRILDGLVFCAFIGRMLISSKAVTIEREAVDGAVGLLFREHYERAMEKKLQMHPLTLTVVERVRRTLKSSTKNIVSYGNYLELNKDEVIGLYWENNGAPFYLIKPNNFNELMGGKFSQMDWKVLVDSGFLKFGKGRGHQYQKRLPDGKPESFIAISTAIMDHEAAPTQ